MTDGEVAPAQSSGLVKPAPPLLWPTPPPLLPQPRAHCGPRRALGQAGRTRARVRVCVCARVHDYRPTG